MSELEIEDGNVLVLRGVSPAMVEVVRACFTALAPPGNGDGDNNDDEDAEPKSAAIVCN
jgi:hypothetical protein